MITIKSLFTYMPYVTFAITFWLFVRRCRFGRVARRAWTLWLLFCCSKFFCFSRLGGDAFYPEFPESLVWFWNWAYSGSLILLTLSFVWWHRSRRWLLPILAWTLSAYGVWCGVKPPAVTQYEVGFDDLPDELDGYRIVHLSDIHVSSAARRWRTERVVEIANAQKGDLVCLTGDIVDGTTKLRLEDVAPLGRLSAKDGVCCSTGNHEFYFGWSRWRQAYEKMGLRFLSNACVMPRKSLAVGGVHDDAVRERKTGRLLGALPDVRQAFAAATNGEFRVLLQHRPGQAKDNVRELGVRLQLSGHTHGGIMPVLTSIVRHHNNGFVRGLYDLDPGRLFVHSGSGQWAGFPTRFFDPSEIAVITLRKVRP